MRGFLTTDDTDDQPSLGFGLAGTDEAGMFLSVQSAQSAV
jgi:hypothetical protein